MPSARRNSARLGALIVSATLLAGPAAGCSTTQEKAERRQARAKHILEARAERHKREKDKDKDKPGERDEKES